MIVVNLSQIQVILFKNNKKISIISNKMLGYARKRPTKIETVYQSMSPHTKIGAYMILFLASHIIKDDEGVGASFIRGNDLFMIVKCKVANTLDEFQKSLQKHVFWLIPRFGIDVDILEPKTVGIDDEGQDGIRFPAVGGAANNITNGIG